MTIYVSGCDRNILIAASESDDKFNKAYNVGLASLKLFGFQCQENLLKSAYTFNLSLTKSDMLPERDLIGELIKNGKYEIEVGDTITTTDSINESIGENQGTKVTRRLYLEILQSGIDLFSDEVLNRLKKENPRLYETILIKTFGHVFSEKGFLRSVNKEGSCEALSMLMLVHSLKKMREQLMVISNELNLKLLKSNGDDQKLLKSEAMSTLYLTSFTFTTSVANLAPKELLNKLHQYIFELNEIESALRQAITAESTDEEIKMACDKIQQNQAQIICAGYDWHSEVLIYKRHKTIYHNRGAFKENGKEIQVAEVDNSSVSEDAIRELSNRFLRKAVDLKSRSPSFLLAKGNLALTNIIEISLKNSKGGHCTHASTKAAIYSLFTNNYPKIERYDLAKPDYKSFSIFNRKCLKKILNKHPVEGLN